MKISIIIPIYNVEKYIIRCLESVKNQTYSNLEVLLINDCGQDNSINLAQKYINNNALNDNYHIIHHKTNKGLSAARNTGILNAKGDFIYFLDSDDSIPQYCIEELVRYIEPTTDYVMGKYQNIPEIQNIYHNKIYKNLDREDITSLYIKQQIPWNAVNRLIRTEFIIKNNLFFQEGITSEDLLWNYISLPYVNNVTITNKITYYYYTNEGSIMRTTNYNYKYMEDLFIISNIIKQTTLNHQYKKLVSYFFSIKFQFIPHAIMWHKYPYKYRYLFLYRLYKNRFSSFYKELPLKFKLKFLLPTPLLSLGDIICYNIFDFLSIIRYKIKNIYLSKTQS